MKIVINNSNLDFVVKHCNLPCDQKTIKDLKLQLSNLEGKYHLIFDCKDKSITAIPL